MIICSLPLLAPHDAAVARQQAQTLAGLVRLGPTEAGRLMVAVSEAARNAVRFGKDARIDLGLEKARDGARLRICVHDRGPGFDVQAALAQDRGLALAQRVAPGLQIDSGPGQRTQVVVTAALDTAPDPAALDAWTARLRTARSASVDEALESHNRELAQMLTRLRENELELEHRLKEIGGLNWELSLANAQLRDKNQLLDDYVSVVSHDLKAPLVGLRHILDDLERDLETGAAHDVLKESVGKASKAAHGMSDLVQALLDHVRRGADGGERAPMALDDVVEETLALLHLPDGFRVDHDVGSVVVATPPRLLHEVLQNLVNNAVEHHDRETGHIVVRARPSGTRVRIEVEDDGPGIPADRAPHVFRLFHSSKPRRDGGPSGVGLAAVKRIVEGQGGRIQVVPLHGRGVRFCFDWPRGDDLAQVADVDRAVLVAGSATGDDQRS